MNIDDSPAYPRWTLLTALALFLLLPPNLWAEEKPLSPELTLAIRNGNLGQLQKLLDAGANVNGRDAQGDTPLILAAFYAGPDSVELLLKKGADVSASNKAGVTPLLRAATDFEKTRLLIQAGAKVKIRSGNLGPLPLANTPLILAARRPGNSKTVKLLLDHGADAKERNGLGSSPIRAAAASGDLETVKLLLDGGADPNDVAPKQPFDESGFLAGMRTPLMWAAYRNDVAMVRQLLDRGADPNLATIHGTPLTHAAWHDSFEAAQLLLERGAKVDTKDMMAGFTALHWAASSESPRPRLVKLLLEKGADPNVTGGEPIDAFMGIPQTPMMLALKRGRTEIVSALLTAKAKEPETEPKRKTPRRPLPDTFDSALMIGAVEKAVALLQTTAAQSQQAFRLHGSKQDCVSCHQQYLPMAAVGHARERAVPLDDNLARHQAGLIGKLTPPFWNPEYLGQTVFHPDPAMSFGYELFGLQAERVAPDPLTDVRIHHLLTIQEASGRWVTNFPRPPLSWSDVSATALAIFSLKHYAWPARQADAAAAIERGKKWLWKAKAETTEEAVFQLLGLHWAGEPPDRLRDLAKHLEQVQNADGGWSQLPTLESDAYATGQVLFTLVQATHRPVSDERWQRGLKYLLATQDDSGAWYVARRAFPVQPTMESGFPYGRDSWISATATSWAVLAITQAMKPGRVASRTLVMPERKRETTPSSTEPVDFVKQIKPILDRSCASCHGASKQHSQFRLDSRDSIFKIGDSGVPAVVPGKSDKSPLLDYVMGRIPDLEMPPLRQRSKYPALTPDEIKLLRAWIDQGAK